MEVAIIGGGMAGLAAAYELTRRGVSCIVLEQQTVGWRGGGSYGRTRMYRHMYDELYFSDLAEQSVAAWHALSTKHGVELIDECGLLFYGDRGGEFSVEGTIPGARATMAAAGRPFEELDAAALRERWPVTVGEGVEALFERQAGTIRAEAALRMFRQVAEACGAVVAEHCAVTRIDDGGDGVVLHTRTGAVKAQRAIVAAGAWTPALLGELGVELDLEIWPMVWGHYRVTAPDYPQWYYFGRQQGADMGLYYGFPAEDGLVKVGLDWTDKRCVRMDEFPQQVDPWLAGRLDDFLHTAWRSIGQQVELQLSPYSMTRDNFFVLDRVPGHPRLSTFTGDCGRAFKFAPLLGEALACVALGETPPFDLTPMAMDRPAVSMTGRSDVEC